MNTLLKNHIIFSFDNPYQIHVAATFYRFLDTITAMNNLRYAPTLGTGFYKGQLEPIVMMDYMDFKKYVHNHCHWLNNQESFMVINPRTPRSIQYQAFLEYNREGSPQERIGDLNEIDGDYCRHYDAWTCINGVYYNAS